MVIDDQMKDSLNASIKEYLFLSWVEIQAFQSLMVCGEKQGLS